MGPLMARATHLTYFSPWVAVGIATLRFDLQVLPDWRQELTDLLDMYPSAFLVLALN